MIRKSALLFITLLLFATACGRYVVKKPVYDYSKMDKTTRAAHKRVEQFLADCVRKKEPVDIPGNTRIDSVRVDKDARHIDIFFNKFFGYIPYRENTVAAVQKALKKRLGWKFRKYSFAVFVKGFPLEELVPNYFRTDSSRYDRSRLPLAGPRPLPVVRNLDRPWLATRGLTGKNIALWHSHGWYFEQKLNRWEWQRARLFQTVEDIGPIQFTLPYLVPMLENAGALTFLPRERDFQTHEVIVDADSSSPGSLYLETNTDSVHFWQALATPGFAIGSPPYETGENPFRQGECRAVRCDTVASATVSYVPHIPETGYYAVYVSYASSDSAVADARYSVYHAGGVTRFQVNQQIGGGTWIYLGRFKFYQGIHPDSGKVVLTNVSVEPHRVVSADAVRFGGGMGNVARNGQVSGRPRFEEGARYYLQYAGMPDTLVFSLNDEQSDYKDDYQSRGEWVNYLKGAPYGPNKNRKAPGLGIPVDLSLAFHTDAGVSRSDTVIGTLAIYSSDGADTTTHFPDGVSRLANRDFADILQTQIVEDLRRKYDPIWRRRGLWDSNYSEAFRPNVPAALLELLSHQNFLDMRFFHDPRFRFDVSRAIYKAILRFLATQERRDYIVRPLPPDNFCAEFTDSAQVTLRWRPVADPLEPTAEPKAYILYTRREDGDFDNGVLVSGTEITLTNLESGRIYSYKVTAVNDGGESFPSEILSVCWFPEQQPVLIVNGFDRLCGPAAVQADSFAGFLGFLDQGVPYGYDIGYTGQQYDFNPFSPWLDDDAPGFGASFADFETTVIAGNRFDYPIVHGRALRAAGRAFVSASDEAVEAGRIQLEKFQIVDWILGEEKETPWPKPTRPPQFKTFSPRLQEKISLFLNAGGNLFLSGAYVGTDLFSGKKKNDPDVRFAREMLKFFWRTDHAARTGRVVAVDSAFLPLGTGFRFVTEANPRIYPVESPDAIEPADRCARTVLRYAENNMSAGVACTGRYKVVVFGFPFETIVSETNREKVMAAILRFFAGEAERSNATRKGHN